jgi:mRNA interferase YafQ
MYEIGYSGRFKKDLKIIKKRSEENYEELRIFIKKLQIAGYQGMIPKHKPHKLSGNFSKHWECHINNDLLLIWLQNESDKTILLVRTGTHSDLF